ncbi:MAG: TonB family protein [Candidatus Eremiobacteraeota bacterium]|nr:TonB family protein [Candidatus Eremiobacteraeota bacterium]
MAKSESPFITGGARVRNFMGAALLVSLLVHLAVGSVMPNAIRHYEDTQSERVTIVQKPTIIHSPPPPTPTPPPPQKTPPPAQQVAARKPLRVNLPKQTSANKPNAVDNPIAQPKNGNPEGIPGGPGTAAPVAVAGTPKPGCANPNAEATVTSPVQPDYPESAKDLGLGEVTAEIEVTVGPSGNLTGASIYKSSGNMAIDGAALRAARESTYSPKFVNCEPTTGDYLFRADFQPAG